MFAERNLNLVPRTRIELVMTGYQPIVIPFNYPGKIGGCCKIRTYFPEGNEVTARRGSPTPTEHPLLLTLSCESA